MDWASSSRPLPSLKGVGWPFSLNTSMNRRGTTRGCSPGFGGLPRMKRGEFFGVSRSLRTIARTGPPLNVSLNLLIPAKSAAFSRIPRILGLGKLVLPSSMRRSTLISEAGTSFSGKTAASMAPLSGDSETVFVLSMKVA